VITDVASFVSAGGPAATALMNEMFKPFDGPETARPRNRAEVIAFAGDPTRGGEYLTPEHPDPTWVKANIREFHGDDAFIAALAGRYFPIHRRIASYAREAFVRAESVHPGYVSAKGTWGFNFRRIGRFAKIWSYHAYGIAIDVNPDDNRAIQFEPGRCPKPWSPEWCRLWPAGVPRELVLAFESCGFSWGGWWTGFCDPMHFEWMGARTSKV
jgi:hypothetical protein